MPSERPFRDRADAGRQLAERMPVLDLPVVLALPRGGVPVGFEVARRLHAPLEVVVARKLGAPGRPELGIGAVAEGGARVCNDRIVGALGITTAQLDEVAAREQVELARRVERYRGGRPLPPLGGRGVVVVDDGLATGVTAEAAISAVRALGPGRLLLAAPVAAGDTVLRLARLVDDVVVLRIPDDFSAVGQWYDDFAQTSDDEVLDLLEAARRHVDSGQGA